MAEKSVRKKSAKVVKSKTVTAKSEPSKAKKRVNPKVELDTQMLESIREQITNVSEEIKLSLAESIRAEYRNMAAAEIRRANRRRRWNNFFHDIVIVIFAVIAVYFGYCLYEIRYFDFLKTDCEKAGNCTATTTTESETKTESAGPVKDAAWYVANYRYLFDNLDMKLDGDNVAAYYLYADDRKVSEIKPEYLLSMAYNQTALNIDPLMSEIVVSADEMSAAYQETFGSLETFKKVDFVHGSLEFTYDQDKEQFVAKNQNATLNQTREIIEKIERIYEEGEVIYVITTAGMYDKTERSFYKLDNLFQPVVSSVEKTDFDLYKTALGKYQYQFKKKNGQYYFSGIVKL